MEVMHRHTMTITPPVTTADTHLRTTVDMPRHITVTGIEEYTVRPMPTTAAPDIMAAGITGGIVIGNSESQPPLRQPAMVGCPDGNRFVAELTLRDYPAEFIRGERHEKAFHLRCRSRTRVLFCGPSQGMHQGRHRGRRRRFSPRGRVRSVLPLGVSLVAMKRTRMRKRPHHKRLLRENNCHLCIRDGRRRSGYARQPPKIGRQSSCNDSFFETAQPNL